MSVESGEVNYFKMNCPLCGGSIEFPAHGLGEFIGCPHCQKQIQLKRIPWKEPPWLSTIFILFIGAIYCIAFGVLLSVAGLFGFCLFSGFLTGFFASKTVEVDSEDKRLWIGVIVCIGITATAWFWFHGGHPAMPAEPQ
jgi:hypothetical protein